MNPTDCPTCDGEVYLYDECDTCGRAGWVVDEEDGGTMTCLDCGGESAVRCRECNGEGVLFND